MTDVAELVGGAAILGHRVVTLSREVHAGLLARPIEADLAELAELGVPYIDLVCVDLYPLADEIAKPGATYESVVEQTDIGGPAMLRSGAKGGRIVICRAEQRSSALEWLAAGEPGGRVFRRQLAAEAERVAAAYSMDSARYLSEGTRDGCIGEVVRTTKYGENAWQAPAHLLSERSQDPLAIDRFGVVAGTDPSYNNLAELNRQLHTITHIAAGFEHNLGETPHIAIGTKHGNPCGAAVGDDPVQVIGAMVMGDPRAIFGGLVIVNFEVTEPLATALLTHGVASGRRLLDGIAAPAFTPEAIALLSRKGDRCRFLANPALADLGVASLDPRPIFRQVRGGHLRQPGYTRVIDLDADDVTRIGEMSDQQRRDVVLAWAVCATSNSNTITLARDNGLIGNGVGQQDRVGCCELAIKRARDAGHSVDGAVAASDSFFPFPDGPEVLLDAGVRAIWATTGSRRDGDTQELCRRRGVTLWQVPDGEGRGFFGH